MSESTSQCAVCLAETEMERVCSACRALAGPQSVIRDRSWEEWHPTSSKRSAQDIQRSRGQFFTPVTTPSVISRVTESSQDSSSKSNILRLFKRNR